MNSQSEVEKRNTDIQAVKNIDNKDSFLFSLSAVKIFAEKMLKFNKTIAIHVRYRSLVV